MAINNHNCIKHFYKGSAPCLACVTEESRLQMKAIARAIPGTIGAMLQDDGANKTLRDEFAMHMAAALLSKLNFTGSFPDVNRSHYMLMEEAYSLADEAMKAREVK